MLRVNRVGPQQGRLFEGLVERIACHAIYLDVTVIGCLVTFVAGIDERLHFQFNVGVVFDRVFQRFYAGH